MDMRSIENYINETMATSVPTLFVASSVHWSTAQQILKVLKINTLTVEGIHKKKFIYGSRSSFNRAINYFEEENKQFHRNKIRQQAKGFEKDAAAYQVGSDDSWGISKSKAKIYLQESEKIQLFLLGSFLNKVDKNFFRFESEKENDHYSKKFKLFNINFDHEINKRYIESPVAPSGIYAVEQRPLTELLLTEHGAKLQSTGVRLYLYSFNEMHGEVFLFLNTIFIPPPRKNEHVDHVYILRHMAVEENWKQIDFTIDEKNIHAVKGDGLSRIFIRDFFSFGNSVHDFNEYKAFEWVKENRKDLLQNTNLSMPKEFLPDFDYAYDFDRYRKVLVDDSEAEHYLVDDRAAKEENDRLNREIDAEQDDGSYEAEGPIEDENAKDSDAFMGPDIPESDGYQPYSEEDERAEKLLEDTLRAQDEKESKLAQAEDEEFHVPVPKISDAEIIEFFHKLDVKQIGLLKKLIDISKK